MNKTGSHWKREIALRPRAPQITYIKTPPKKKNAFCFIGHIPITYAQWGRLYEDNPLILRLWKATKIR